MPGETEPGNQEANDKNEGGQSSDRGGEGGRGRGGRSTEEPLCALEPGPEGFALHLPPTGPRRLDKDASRLPPPLAPRLSGQSRPPAGPCASSGSSLGRWEKERDSGAGEISHHALLHGQVFPSLCLSFPPDSKV